MRNAIIDSLISWLRGFRKIEEKEYNAEMTVYEAGTMNLKETYTSKECDILNTNPIILPRGGKIEIWV